MEETRVKKYEKYRNSLKNYNDVTMQKETNNEDDDKIIEIGSSKKDKQPVTSTIISGEVINALNETDEKEKEINKRKGRIRISTILSITLIVVLLVGLIILGYFAFRGNK